MYVYVYVGQLGCGRRRNEKTGNESSRKKNKIKIGTKNSWKRGTCHL